MIYVIVMKNRDEKETLRDKNEDNENDYINFDDFITPNLYIGRKNNNEILRKRNSRSQINHFK